ncbi:polysaccharide biosynthesis protein, partial [Paracoccaceae bacterium]|nr:polysaccharide biosynthesis protein [Paracoccaceae bacterium]
SVIPFFIKKMKSGCIPVTDVRMTRFMITLEDGVRLVWTAFDDMMGGEIYVKKIPSMTLPDIAEAVASGVKQEIIGIRPGEKLHEQMIGVEDAPNTFSYSDYFKILPQINGWNKDSDRIKDGKLVDPNFIYSSDSNSEWFSIKELQAWIKNNADKIGVI